jgi:hypothetical protein
MARADWKRGRFSIDHETDQMHHALRGWQSSAGDEIAYYRFNRQESGMHPVYDEPSGTGRVYDGPIEVPVLHVTHDEGGTSDTGGGFYFNDNLYITASFEQISRTGLTFMDLEHNEYLRDRIIYNDKVFRVMDIHVVGQVQQRDVTVSLEATQVKPDELVNDPQFKRWSA